MYIGLIRHFKVDCNHDSHMTSDEFIKSEIQYNNSDIIINDVDLGEIEWHICFSSDLPRSIKTAQTLFQGKITLSPLLREVPVSPIFSTNLKLPYKFWMISSRYAWLFKHKSQNENKKATERRAQDFLNNLDFESDKNILICSHGFFMDTLHRQLKAIGFSSNDIKKFKNGTLYLYKK
ncbi:histidine phosphatase family protein [Clostridium botulinum]|uniref:histidine phosphatase family protein n=1 Tax=Clostridium botulinum TaxID=1491 RepID=UPI001FD659F1|nr:histidine phosphatase family protein [Clostridium botulinum]MCJ8174437.1 histidine phosphatase family protein [Clostridium botulinum]